MKCCFFRFSESDYGESGNIAAMNRVRHSLIGRIIGILAFIVIALEFRGAFTGKLAFMAKPTLVITPIHAPYLDDEQIADARLALERELAAGGNHALYPKSLIENFYLERDNATDVFDGSYRGKPEAFELGKSLGVERIALVSIYGRDADITIHLALHDIATDQMVTHEVLKFPDFQSMLDWKDEEGLPMDISEGIGSTVPGMSAGALLYFIWLGLSLIPSVLLIFGFKPWRGLLESLLTIGLLLSLFSWIYALNGDMDYVQRFVATSGSLDIADTAAERAATLWRYVAPMVLLASAWILDAIRRLEKLRGSGNALNAASLLDAGAPLLAALSGILFALSFPNFLVLTGLPFLAWFALAPLYVAFRRTSWRRGVSMALLFTGLQALLVNWWQGTFSYVSLPFTVSLTIIQYLPFIVLLVATVRFFPRCGLWAAPLLWTAFDWLRSLGFLGYPWGILGASQYGNTSLIQVASLGGVWAVSLLTHLSGAVIAMGLEKIISGELDIPLLRSSSARGGSGGFAPGLVYFLRPWRPAIILAAAVLSITAGGAISMHVRDNRAREGRVNGETRQIRILAVQQNTDPRKHDYRLSFEELSRLTEEAIGEAARSGKNEFDLVAWPESGFVPDMRFWLDESRARRSRAKLVIEMLDWQASLGINMVTGTQDHFYEALPPSDDPDTPEEIKRIRNSAVFLKSDRTDLFDREYYYKMRLVPFTENFPYDEQFPEVAELLHNFSTTQWTPGTEHHVFKAPAFSFSTPICFEDVFPDHVRRYVLAGAEVLVNMSNDYWANTPLEGYQHAAHAVFRAVENRRPLIRATCSGWTVSVDPEGRISEDWPPFYTPGWVSGEYDIPLEPELSFYTRTGDWLPVLCGIIWMVLIAADFIFRRRGEYR